MTATISSSAKNVGVFFWSNVTGTTAGTDKLHIGQVQLEKKSSASDFSFEPYTDLLQRCQRYFQGYSENTGSHTVFTAVGHAFTTSARIRHPFPTPMRVFPTITHNNLAVLGKTSSTITSFTYTIAGTQRDIDHLAYNVGYSSNAAFNTPSGLNGASQIVVYLVSSASYYFLSSELGV